MQNESRKSIMFYEKCRLCLDKLGVCNMFEKEDLVQDIFNFTGVRVSSSDNLPQKICEKCLEIMTEVKYLKIIAAKNDYLLRSLFDDEDEDVIQPSQINIDQPSKAKENETSKTKNTDEKCLNRSQSSSEREENNIAARSPQKISIRKDLFEPSTIVSSSTKVKKKIKKDDVDDGLLVKRMKSDLEEYECQVCTRRYETSKKLYLHMRQHNKTFLCPLDACDKKFPTRGDLEKHIRTHTGEKPYPCDLCEKRFAQVGTLKSHKQSVHTGYIIGK